MMKKVTNNGMGRGESKIWHFRGDVIFEWSLKIYLHTLFSSVSSLLYCKFSKQVHQVFHSQECLLTWFIKTF